MFQDGSGGYRPTSHRLHSGAQKTIASIDRSVRLSFSEEHKKNDQTNTVSTSRLVRTHYGRPHISGEIEPISTLSAVKVHRLTGYNTSMRTARNTPCYLPAAIAHGRTSHLIGHGLSMELKKCTAQSRQIECYRSLPSEESRIRQPTTASTGTVESSPQHTS